MRGDACDIYVITPQGTEHVEFALKADESGYGSSSHQHHFEPLARCEEQEIGGRAGKWVRAARQHSTTATVPHDRVVGEQEPLHA
jgi:hypothetical protein